MCMCTCNEQSPRQPGCGCSEGWQRPDLLTRLPQMKFLEELSGLGSATHTLQHPMPQEHPQEQGIGRWVSILVLLSPAMGWLSSSSHHQVIEFNGVGQHRCIQTREKLPLPVKRMCAAHGGRLLLSALAI